MLIYPFISLYVICFSAPGESGAAAGGHGQQPGGPHTARRQGFRGQDLLQRYPGAAAQVSKDDGSGAHVRSLQRVERGQQQPRGGHQQHDAAAVQGGLVLRSPREPLQLQEPVGHARDPPPLCAHQEPPAQVDAVC